MSYAACYSYLYDKYYDLIGMSFEFEVQFLYVGNDIILMIDSSRNGIFCCQLDWGLAFAVRPST